MKKFLSLLALLSLPFVISSCAIQGSCSSCGHKHAASAGNYGQPSPGANIGGQRSTFAGSYQESYQVKRGYDIVREEHVVDAKSGLVEVTETKVPRYVTKTRTKCVPCPSCTRYYQLNKGCCGSSTEAARKMASAQGDTGSPHIGLIPTMKTIIE